MRLISNLDLLVIFIYLALVFILGLLLTRRAGQSIEHFFVGGRGLSWWLIGVSMAATNFSIDTPISITGFIAKEGIGGIWFFWSGAISAVLVTFLFARLWRRSEVLTDAEIIELRYSGPSAAILRLFKGFYFGILFNAFIMAWVFLALSKVLNGVSDLNPDHVLIVATVLVFLYTIASGYYGVVLTDFFQYFIALIGSVLLAIFAVMEVGGLKAMVHGIQNRPDLSPRLLDFFPSLSGEAAMPASVFLSYLLLQWWAHKYADGGGKHIQRMLSAKDEEHAVKASFFFAFANYALQVWPWILTALASLLLFGKMADPEMGYAMVMARVLPSGLLGLVLACLIGAFMSTIDTHLNLGASYIVNDIYKRFLRPEASPTHYVRASRLSMALLLALAVLLSKNMDSVGEAWKFLLTFASGAGLTWILRWFWWRINAWTELSGMLSSGIIATWLQVYRPEWLFSQKIVLTVGITTLVWLSVTYLTAPTDEGQLLEFVRRIRPGSLGWRRLHKQHGIKQEPFLMRALGYWLLGLIALFSLNFSLGSFLLLRPLQGVLLLLLSLLSFVVLFLLARAQATLTVVIKM